MFDDCETTFDSHYSRREDSDDTSQRTTNDVNPITPINAQPQDFVIVRGHTYRVSRTQLSDSSEIYSPISPDYQSYKQALQEAYALIEKQKRQIEELQRDLEIANIKNNDKGKIN